MEYEEQRRKRKALVDVGNLRERSRQEYLKKREKKKLQELRDDLADEQYLFGDARLSRAESLELRYKQRIAGILIDKDDADNDGGECYRFPETYDDERSGHVSQEKRFFAARRRDSGPDKEEDPSWEDIQIRRSSKGSGSSRRVKKSNLNPNELLVFEEEASMIEFIRGQILSGEDQVSERDLLLHHKQHKHVEEEEEVRKSLPVYKYRDELLRSVHKYQILIIVSPTGSGKTTQIPQYLHEAGFTKHGKAIACTQPRRVAAMSVASRVALEMGVRLGQEVGYSVRFEDRTSKNTALKYMTDGMLLREFLIQPKLESYSVIIVDEAHERTLSTDVLFGLLKDLARDRPDLKLLISSATLDAAKFSDYFDSAPILKIPGSRFRVEINYTRAPEADYMDAAVTTALQIHLTEPPGDILVFLPGQEEIETAHELLKDRTRGALMLHKIPELIICPIYASLPSHLQAKIFEPTPQGARKVVLATNIAETSLTIDGIKYVIDPGFAKIKSYNPRSGVESLLTYPISKASADQRAGRCGRTGPGKCFRLYTANTYNKDLEDNTAPEILRTNLDNVVLSLKSLGIDDLLTFDFMDPPRHDALLKAMEVLVALGALDKYGELTKVGRMMAQFPLDPKLSRMILASDKHRCCEEILSIAAMLSVGSSSIFYRPKDKKVHADNAHMNFYVGNVGDHVALLRVYNSWKESNFSANWCYENFIQHRSLMRARDIRDQLVGLLDKVGIESSSNPNDLESINKSIASGYFPNVARLHKDGSYRTLRPPLPVYIHPSSGLARDDALPARWVLYHELVLTKKEYMRQVSEIKPEWLLEIAPCYYPRHELENMAVSRKMPRALGRVGGNSRRV